MDDEKPVTNENEMESKDDITKPWDIFPQQRFIN